MNILITHIKPDINLNIYIKSTLYNPFISINDTSFYTLKALHFVNMKQCKSVQE